MIAIPALAGVLGIWASSACPAPSADTGTRGHGDAATGGRAVGALPPAEATAVAASAPVLGAAMKPRFRRSRDDARFPVSPPPRVPASDGCARLMLPRLRPSPADPPVSADDPWLGEDKLKHFLMSFAVTSIGYAAARTAGLAHDPALVAGAGAAAAAGIWKEAHDRATGGDVSARDLTWDAVGIAAGGVLAVHTR